MTERNYKKIHVELSELLSLLDNKLKLNEPEFGPTFRDFFRSRKTIHSRLKKENKAYLKEAISELNGFLNEGIDKTCEVTGLVRLLIADANSCISENKNRICRVMSSDEILFGVYSLEKIFSDLNSMSNNQTLNKNNLSLKKYDEIFNLWESNSGCKPIAIEDVNLQEEVEFDLNNYSLPILKSSNNVQSHDK